MKRKLRQLLLVNLICLSTCAYAFPCFEDSTKGWRELFNGKDLSGWKHLGPGNMAVENRLIQTHGGMGLLYWTREKFGNCTIKVVYRMEKENSNAGFFIRIPIEPREAMMPVWYGY